jgi:hypothetical protein
MQNECEEGKGRELVLFFSVNQYALAVIVQVTAI